MTENLENFCELNKAYSETKASDPPARTTGTADRCRGDRAMETEESVAPRALQRVLQMDRQEDACVCKVSLGGVRAWLMRVRVRE